MGPGRVQQVARRGDYVSRESAGILGKRANVSDAQVTGGKVGSVRWVQVVPGLNARPRGRNLIWSANGSPLKAMSCAELP